MENSKSWCMGERRLSDRKLLEELLATKRGIVLLNGPINCGKTRLLLKMQAERDAEIIKISSRTFVEVLVDDRIRPRETVPRMIALFGNADLIIEDFDYPLKGETTQLMSGWILTACAREHLVILSGTRLDKVLPFLREELPGYVVVQHLWGVKAVNV